MLLVRSHRVIRPRSRRASGCCPCDSHCDFRPLRRINRRGCVCVCACVPLVAPLFISTCAPRSTIPATLSQKARCAAFHRCLSSASPRDAARLQVMLRVLLEWVLARSAPASPLARACALHLLCRDAGVLDDAGIVCWPGCSLWCFLWLCVCACSATWVLTHSFPASPLVHACALHLLCRRLLSCAGA